MTLKYTLQKINNNYCKYVIINYNMYNFCLVLLNSRDINMRRAESAM